LFAESEDAPSVKRKKQFEILDILLAGPDDICKQSRMAETDWLKSLESCKLRAIRSDPLDAFEPI
jgi:hypothetical protein